MRSTRPSLRSHALGVALAATGSLANAQQYGISSPSPIAPYLNNIFSDRAPGAADTYTIVPAYPALTFQEPLVITSLPHEPTMLVATRQGHVYSFADDEQTTTRSTFIDLTDRCADVWDGGMMGFAPHPNFGLAGEQGHDEVYAFYCYSPSGSFPTGQVWGFFGCYLRLSRFTVPNGASVPDPASEEVLIQKRLYNISHRAGHIAFGPDGFLYVPIGDQFRYETAQNITTDLEGGVLRIDVDMDPARSHVPTRTLPVTHSDELSGAGYWIPNDNPFIGAAPNAFEEYWSIGHRNPHRMTFDRVSGQLWIGEVGENDREEINLVERGDNHGWPFREGLIAGPRNPPSTILGDLTDPVVDYTRAQAFSIIGGYRYRGAEHPGLFGKFICADYSQNRLFALEYEPSSQSWDSTQVGSLSPGRPITFGETPDGELLIGRQSSSTTLYKLQGTNPGPEPPQWLSQVGAFSDLANLTPVQGLIPYDLNAPFWSDNAEKARWIAIPNDGSHDTAAEQVVFDERGKDWTFPVGSVAVKHFELGVDDTDPLVTRRLETRFTVFAPDGAYGVSYHWLPDGSDAQLATVRRIETIDIATASGTRQQDWIFPGRQDCVVCHTDVTGGALGLRTHQLNGDLTYPASGITDNQLRTWNHLGIFAGGIVEADIPSMPRAAALGEAGTTREHQARSYLDSNCAHCHRPDGGNRAVFDARFSTPLYATDLLFGELSDGLGVPDSLVVSPRRRLESAAYLRTDALGGIAMPPLAKNVIHAEGVDVLADWIRNLDPSEHLNLGQPAEPLELVDGWQSNLVINETASFSNLLGPPVDVRIEAFRFWAHNDGAPVTPFVVEFIGPGNFDVVAVGTTRYPGDYELGENTFAFVDGGAPRVTLGFGESVAVGFLDAAADGSGSGGGSVIPYCVCNGADSVWITGGWNGGDSGSVAVGSPPTQGSQTFSSSRDYAFSIDVVVEGPNSAPTLGALANQSTTEAADTTFSFTATDAPDDVLVFLATGMPPGLVLDPETGEVSGATAIDAEGTYPVTVVVSDGLAEDSGTFDLVVHPQPIDELFGVFTDGARAPNGLETSGHDVARLDATTGTWSLHLDGSDVGIDAPITGLHRETNGDFLMTFGRTLDLPGLAGGPNGTTVEPMDVVRFVPTSIGRNTAGSFQFVLDGSDLVTLAQGAPGGAVGDTRNAFDALTRLAGGELAFSTVTRTSLSGTPVRDEDLVRFQGTGGANTVGRVDVVLRGADIGLGDSGEDIAGAAFFPALGELFWTSATTTTAHGPLELRLGDIGAYEGPLGLPSNGPIRSFARREGVGLSDIGLRAFSVR